MTNKPDTKYHDICNKEVFGYAGHNKSPLCRKHYNRIYKMLCFDKDEYPYVASKDDWDLVDLIIKRR